MVRSILAIGLAFCTSMVWASKPLVDAPLTWRPTSTIQDFKIQPIDLNQFRGAQISITVFTNTCLDRTLIGENRENEDKPKEVRTNTDISGFVTNQTKGILKDLGFPISDKPELANISLHGEIFKFGVIERNTYVGDVRLKLTIFKGTEVAWEGMAFGQAKRFGRSYRLENYCEVISDSLLEAITKVASSQAFIDGISGQGTVAKMPNMSGQGFSELNKIIRENTQKISPGKVFRLAVIPFIQTESQRYIDKGFGAYLTENIISILGSIKPSIHLYERSRLDAILKEQTLSANGLFSETEAKRLGELAPIDYVLTGTITRLDDSITMNARFIDVVSGEVISSFSASFSMYPELETLFAKK